MGETRFDLTDATYLNLLMLQPLGIRFTHSIPLSFISASGFSPLVTASVITDRLYCSRVSIWVWISAARASISAHLASRYFAILLCSSRGALVLLFSSCPANQLSTSHLRYHAPNGNFHRQIESYGIATRNM